MEQKQEVKNNIYPFLNGGGEMGALIRGYGWGRTAIGTPDKWPQSLRTVVGIILNSKFPMFLFWGGDLIQFYNDAYRPSLGNGGKHPAALGGKGVDTWQEIWPFIKPLIDQVMAGGEATWNEDQLLPIYRNGRLEDVYWTFSYSPVLDEAGAPGGVLVTCTETTEKVTSAQELKKHKEELEFAIEATELGTWDLNPATGKFKANARLKEWFGLLPGEEIPLTHAVDIIAVQDREQVTGLINRALQYSSGGRYDTEFTIVNPITGQVRLVHAKGRAWFGNDKVAYRFNGTLQDITAERKAKQEAGAAQQLADIAISSAGLGIFRIDVVTREMEYSPAFARILTGDPGRKGLTRTVFREYVHPDDEPLRVAASDLFDATGRFDYQIRVIWDDSSAHLISLSGTMMPFEPGRPLTLAGTIKDVTEQEAHKQALQEAEHRHRLLMRENEAMFRNVTNSSPTGLWLSDEQGGFTYVNKTLVDWTGMPYESFLGTGWISVIIEEDRARTVASFTNAIATRSHCDTQFRIHKGNGSTIWCQAAGDPFYREDGSYAGYAGFCMDITGQIAVREKIEANRQQLLASFESAPVAIAVISKYKLTFRMANPFYGELVGRTPEEIIDKPLLEALPELKGQGFDKLLEGVIEMGAPYNAKEVSVELQRNGQLETRYVDLSYQPMYEGKQITGILVVATDVTEQVIARKKIEESEAKFRSLIEEAPVATCLFTGRNLVIEIANDLMIGIWGKGKSALGKPLAVALPELEGQPYLGILERVFDTGITHEQKAAFVELVVDGRRGNYYFDITYKAVYDAMGKVYGIMQMAVDVTEQALAKQKLEESELFSRSIFHSSPVAKVVFEGRDMVIRTINENMQVMLGRNEGVIGMPFMEAVPELKETPLMDRLRHVLETGETYAQPEEKIILNKDGQPYTGYYNYIYKVLRNTEGKIYGVMVTATEVTEQVMARQKIEEAQATLRDAIELAELGTWSIDMQTSRVTCSPRMAQWFGIDNYETEVAQLINAIHPDDRQRIADTLTVALQSGASGAYDEECTVVNIDTGKNYILHAQGRTILSPQGIPVKIEGSAQDITEQRNIRMVLENQVQQRTEELASAVEELRTTNEDLQIRTEELASVVEELRATNEDLQERTEELASSNEELQASTEELAETNGQLLHSNDELAQYAYVASHDLQEPLRKIRVFTGMLAGNKELPGNTQATIGKISNSAERMSMLIQDLLSFSRLLKSDTLMRPVALRDIVKAVSEDFELVIAEKGAVIELGGLPVIEAVSLQMNQLFYNLISNALKFTDPRKQAHIAITARVMPPEEVQRHISKPFRFCQYYHIEVRDNGIGFEAQYHEQIFEVFKRLHGRDMYPGSGIGLALCRRIVANHNGHLFAASVQGEGSQFHIIMPDRQQDAESVYINGGDDNQIISF